MAYYMRFLPEQAAELTLDALEAALQAVNPDYALVNRQYGTYDAADLMFEGEIYAELEINRLGDDLFADEIAELVDELDQWTFDDPEEQQIQASLRQRIGEKQQLVSAMILFGDSGLEDGIQFIEPLWNWLFTQYDGVLQVDYEGYYDRNGLLLDLAEDNN